MKQKMYIINENETIKDILRQMQEYFDYDNGIKCDGKLAYFKEDVFRELINYITNLQENARGQVNDYFKDKYADEVLKNAKLQEENEILKNGYCELKVKCNNGECDCTNEEYEGMVQANMRCSLLLDDYKSRNEKAIKDMQNFIEKNYNNEYLDLSIVNYWLNILNGDDE